MAERTEERLVGRSIRELALPALLGTLGLVFLLDLVRRLFAGSLDTGTFGTFLWDGVVFGMAIGLAGIGLALTYSILQFANFAHGDYLTAGAFFGWIGTFVVAGASDIGLKLLVLVSSDAPTNDLGIHVLATPLAILVGVVIAAGATAALALGIDRVVFKPMRDAGGIALLIASVGVALALRHTLLIIFQGSSRSLTTDVPRQTIGIGDGVISVGAHEVTLFVLAAVLMLGTHLLLRYTKLGTAMRAMADNEDLALVTGIPTERVVRTTWLLGGALTGAAGFLIALESGSMNTSFGWELLLVIFSGVILGGIGSVYGAIVGGLVIGIASRLSLIWLPSELILAGAFVVMIVALLVRPQGLLGGVKTV